MKCGCIWPLLGVRDKKFHGRIWPLLGVKKGLFSYGMLLVMTSMQPLEQEFEDALMGETLAVNKFGIYTFTNLTLISIAFLVKFWALLVCRQSVHTSLIYIATSSLLCFQSMVHTKSFWHLPRNHGALNEMLFEPQLWQQFLHHSHSKEW